MFGISKDFKMETFGMISHFFSDFSSNAKVLQSAISLLPALTERKRCIDMHYSIASSLLKSIQSRSLNKFFEVEERISSGATGSAAVTKKEVLRMSSTESFSLPILSLFWEEFHPVEFTFSFKLIRFWNISGMKRMNLRTDWDSFVYGTLVMKVFQPRKSKNVKRLCRVGVWLEKPSNILSSND